MYNFVIAAANDDIPYDFCCAYPNPRRVGVEAAHHIFRTRERLSTGLRDGYRTTGSCADEMLRAAHRVFWNEKEKTCN